MWIRTNTQRLTEEVFISFTNSASTSFWAGVGWVGKETLRLIRNSSGKIRVKNTLWMRYTLRMKQENIKWDML